MKVLVKYKNEFDRNRGWYKNIELYGILESEYPDQNCEAGNTWRGLIEEGVGYASTYPGTPSSEIGDVLYQVHEKAGIKFEFSVNEKVAVESAFAAAVSGVRSFVFMKHVGMNVASDPMMSIAYTGTRAGMVIMTADDLFYETSHNGFIAKKK